MILAPWQQWW